MCLVSQSCLTLSNPKDCSPLDSSVHGDSPGKNTGVVCHALLQGIFLTQGLNPGLPHCWLILYHLSQQGSPEGIMLSEISQKKNGKHCMFSFLWGIKKAKPEKTASKRVVSRDWGWEKQEMSVRVQTSSF